MPRSSKREVDERAAKAGKERQLAESKVPHVAQGDYCPHCSVKSLSSGPCVTCERAQKFINHAAPKPAQEPPVQSEKEPTIAETLHNLLTERLGDNWRQDVSLTLRADVLYWIVYLAEKGIELRKAEMRADKTNRLAEVVASIASWQIDLDNLVKRIESTFPPKKR